MKKSVKLLIVIASLTTSISVVSSATALNIPNPLNNTPLQPVGEILRDKINFLVKGILLDLNAALEEISPELAHTVRRLLEHHLGGFGLVDPSAIRETVVNNWSITEAGYSAPSTAKELIRHQNQQAVSALLSEEGQQRSKDRLNQQASFISLIKSSSDDSKNASNNVDSLAARTSESVRDLSAVNSLAQKTKISQEAIKALVNAQVYLGEQNSVLSQQNSLLARQKLELAKQNVELGNLLANLNIQLIEAANREALQLETMNNISSSLDSQLMSETSENIRIGFGTMKNYVDNSFLIH